MAHLPLSPSTAAGDSVSELRLGWCSCLTLLFHIPLLFAFDIRRPEAASTLHGMIRVYYDGLDVFGIMTFSWAFTLVSHRLNRCSCLRLTRRVKDCSTIEMHDVAQDLRGGNALYFRQSNAYSVGNRAVSLLKQTAV